MKPKVLLLLPFFLLLAGCAGQYDKYADSFTNINTSNSRTAVAFFETQNIKNKLVMEKLAENGNETAMVMYALMTNQSEAQVVGALRAVAPEKPTTANDVWLGVATSTIPTIARWGFGYLGVSKLVDAMDTAGSTYVMSGENAKIEGAFNNDSPMTGNWSPVKLQTTGEGNSVSVAGAEHSPTSTTTTETTETTTTTTGDVTTNEDGLF